MMLPRAATLEPILQMLDPIFSYSATDIRRLLDLWRFPTSVTLGALENYARTLDQTLAEKIDGHRVWPGWHWQQTTPHEAFLAKSRAWKAAWITQPGGACGIGNVSGQAESSYSVSSRMILAGQALRFGHDPTCTQNAREWLVDHRLAQGLSFANAEIDYDGLYSVPEAASLFEGHRGPIRAWLQLLAASNQFSPCGDMKNPGPINGIFLPRWQGKSWVSADASKISPMLGQMTGKPQIIDCLDYYPPDWQDPASIMMAMYLAWIWVNQWYTEDNDELPDWVPTDFFEEQSGSFLDLAREIFDGEILTTDLSKEGLAITRSIYATYQQVFRDIAAITSDLDSWVIYHQLRALLDVYRK